MAHADSGEPGGWNPYTFGKSVAAQEGSQAVFSNSYNQAGVRYWVSSSEISYDVEKSPRLSRLDYKVDDSMAGEAFFYLGGRNSRYTVKGVFGAGGDQNGNVDDSDYNSNGSKGLDTKSDLSNGRLFYAYADFGYKLNALSSNTSRTSLLGGVGYIQDVMTARGVTCKQKGNGSYASSCTSGAGQVVAGTSIKALQNDAQWTIFRLGLENYYVPSRRFSWRNEVVVVPYAAFHNRDSHYLRTDLGTGQPNIVDNADYAFGGMFETNLEYKITPRWAFNVGGRYWRFYAPETTTKFGNPVSGTEKSYKWDYQRYGVFIGSGYHF